MQLVSVSEILQLRGPRALSQFRLAKLLASLQKIDPDLRSLSAEYRYFVELERGLEPHEARTLRVLLDDGGATLEEDADSSIFLVVPRLGTVSPWSSKASDIARNCGLTPVKRIERGTLYYVGSKQAALAAGLHDRMTQTVLRSFDEVARLFQHIPARAVQTIRDIRMA
ncbi:MAG: phosphoribosylformylglycinamidine synthase, partial [Burkholderiales bacterium]